MTSDILPKLFGNPARAKLLRLFIFNPEGYFSVAELTRRTKLSGSPLKKELSLLTAIGILKTKASDRNKQWALNQEFFFVDHLRSLFNAEFFANRDELAKKFKLCGKIRLLLLSGVFMQDGGERVDILLVGDDLKKRVVEKTVAGIETEIGRELTYAIMDTKDFIYRQQSSDKFIRDILDYPHKCIIDKMPASV